MIKAIEIVVLATFLCVQVSAWCLKTSTSHGTSSITHIQYSYDRRYFATIASNKVVLWSANNQRPLTTLAHSGTPTDIAFSPNSTMLAIAQSGSIEFFSLTTPYGIITANTFNPGHGSGAIKIDFSPDSAYLLTCGGTNNKVRLWDLTYLSAADQQWNVVGANDCAVDLSYNPAVSTSSAIQKYLASGGSSVWSVTHGSCYGIDYSPDGNKLAASCNQGGIQVGLIFDASTGASTILHNGADAMKASSYSQDGQTVAFGGDSRKVAIYDVASSSQVMTEILDAGVVSMDFSEDGDFLLVTTSSGTIYEFAKYCLDCPASYFLNTSSITCELCSQFNRACGNCINSTYCIQCTQGYYLADLSTNLQPTRECLSCSTTMAGCGGCNTSSICIFCLPGYYLNTSSSSNICYTCDSTIPGCLRCVSNTTCEQCDIGFSLNSGGCTPCSNINHCLLCNASNLCLECEMGYYVPIAGASSCTACASNCLACVNGSFCVQCLSGYYPDSNGACIACPGGCLTCNNSGTCIECTIDRYLASPSNVCTPCSYPCFQCQTSATNCLSCVLGFSYESGTNSCIACSNPCATCSVTPTTCISCTIGYFLETSPANTCSNCDNLKDHCSECTPTDCLNCTVGYYLDASKNCIPCSKDMYACIACTTASNCVACSVGHYQAGGSSAGNSSCKACTNGCQLCDSPTNCWGCLPGFYLPSGGNTCSRCQAPCTECFSATECLECEQGYYLDGTDCKECSLALDGCLMCDDEDYVHNGGDVVCTSCILGTFLDSGVCTNCSQPCIVCNTSTNCHSCEIGYYLTLDPTPGTDYICLLCMDNCSTCESATFCTSCSIGYYLDVTGGGTSSKCELCSQLSLNCLTCNKTHCHSCVPGYFMDSANNNKCVQCNNEIQYCEVCSDSTHCQSCSFGYLLAPDTLSCIVCSDSVYGCFDCSYSLVPPLTDVICDVCETGYFLSTVNPGECQICPAGCSTCVDDTNCTTCRPSYVLDTSDDMCKICSSFIEGCQLCTSDASLCINCLNGYYLDTPTNTSCLLCRSAMKGCQFCSSSAVCERCLMGYYLPIGGTQCQLCETAIQGCQVCEPNGTDICLMCQNGYYLSGGDCYLCVSSVPGCALCQDDLQCSMCLQGYYLDLSSVGVGVTTGLCRLCTTDIEGCISCEYLTGTSSLQCAQCEAGYYLRSSDKECVACPNPGCQICLQASPNQCSSCNTMYFLSGSQTCLFCMSYMQGCTQCTSSTVCTLCQHGYFLNSSNKCQLCQQSLEGCGKCNSSTQCFQCKSSYYLLANNTCETCLNGIEGCAYCLDTSQCIACSSGYYYNSSTKFCDLCTNIQGCLTCSDPTTCLVCQGDYFLEVTEDKCYPCNVLQGCYSCVDNTTCKVCIGGYLLNDDKECEIMAVSADEDVGGMKMITQYESKDKLSHSLLPREMKYNQINYTVSEWNENLKIILKYPDFSLHNLTITSVSWEGPQDLKFYTNNPLGDLSLNSIPARRILSSMPDGYMSYIDMKQETINAILPDLYMNRNLQLSYDLSNSEFVASITKQKVGYIYSIFGIFVTLILLINYIIRAKITCPNEAVSEYGQIFPHIVALKGAPFVIYPIYAEEVAYAYGFMTSQFPWANQFFGSELSDRSELVPSQYSVYYLTMGFSSTYTLGLFVSVSVALIIWICYKNKTRNNKNEKLQNIDSQESLLLLSRFNWGVPHWPIKIVLYNFLIFGLVFHASASFQGALLNPISKISVSAVFSVIGIVCLIISLGDSILSIKQSPLFFFKLRVFTKAVLLSACFNSPLYIFCTCFIMDILLMVIEYRLTNQFKSHPRLWIYNNVMANLTLLFLVILHSHYVTLIFASIMVSSIIIVQIYVHIKDYSSEQKSKKFISKRDFVLADEGDSNQVNIWDVNFGKEAEKEYNDKGTKQNKDNQKTLYDPEGQTKAQWRKTRQNRKPKKEKKLNRDNLFIQKVQDGSSQHLDSMNNEDERGDTFLAHDFLQN